MQRVADALTRAELRGVRAPQPTAALCWARGRDPVRGRCIVPSGDASCTRAASSSCAARQRQGQPRRAAPRRPRGWGDTLAELEARGEAVTARAVAQAAHISQNSACTRAPASAYRAHWRRHQRYQLCTLALIALHITALIPAWQRTPHVQAANPRWRILPGKEPSPPETPSAPRALAPSLPGACLAASHRLLWQWCAGTWHCPLCDPFESFVPGSWNLGSGGTMR